MIYWIKKILWIFLVIIVLPIIINFILLIPTFSPIVGDNIVWLSFWGTYLSAIISTGAAFYILYIQRNDNKTENKTNRDSNKTQNEANRQLQLNIMKYQQQSNWLNKFRDIGLEYCNSLNHNDLILFSNVLWNHPNDAYDMLKPLFDRVVKANTRFLFIRKQEQEADELYKQIEDIYSAYKVVLYDLQWIALYYMSTSPEHRDRQGCIYFMYQQHKTQNDIKHIMQLLGEPYYEPNNRKSLDYIVQEIISEAKRYEPDVRRKIYEYIKKEQERIDNLLTEKLN